MKRKLFALVLSIISAICLAVGLSACGNSNDNSSDNSGGGSDNSKTETVSVTSVSLDKSTLDLTVGESYTLSATISPSNATNTNVTWRSSASSIATVSNGNVTAVAAGTATITVTTTDGGYTATCAVTVTENTVTEHNYISVVTAPTCTEKGYTTFTCSDCGETYIDNYVDATGHTESQAVIENYISATCTSDGSYESVIYCSACGIELSRETITIPATGHNYASSVTAPTCTEGGYTTHTCPDCGDSYRDNETAALGHTWNDGEITTSPTCTETGVKTYTCTSCGETITEVIPVTEHSYEISVTQPTCTEGGYTTYTCSVCGYSYVDNYTEATDHNYELSWTWDNYSSATATFVCANNENHTEILTATITNEITTAATCNETGIKLYTATVTLNNATYTDTKTEVISAVEHTYENGICTVCGFEEDASYGLTYTLSNDGTYYTVSGIGTCVDTEIIIPSTYNFLPVKAIAANAFYNCTSFTSVTIPDSITSIGNSAFYYCTSLTEINFNATAMDDLSSDNFVFYWAGQDGNGITVNIGANVTKIPVCLFCPTYSNGCAPKIIHVVFKENSVCESIDNYAFYNCAALKSITLPDSITSVGSYAFRGCTSLTSVSIPDNVTSINCGAFYDCTALTNVSIPNSVTSIDYYAFYNCTSLTNITIGNEVNYIGSEAFYNCLALTEINFNATAMNDFFWNSYVFYRAGQNNEGITVNIGATVTKIPAYLFQSTYSLGETPKITSVVFEDGSACESIGEYAFYNCTTLTNITIGENVKSIGEYAFGFCTSLTTAAIGENVTSIGGYAFYYCTSLTNIIIPNSITSIDEMAFGSCYKLVEVYNLSSLEITAGSSDNGYVAYYAKTVFTGTSGNSNLIYSGDYIFYKDNGTYYIMCYTGSDTDITLPNNINGYSYSIYQYAFYNCISLESITISNGVTAIGYEAFRSCTSLKTATIGNSVTSIGNYAFQDCSSLTNIAIGSSITSFGNDVFFNSLYYNNSSNWENNVLYIGNYLIKAKADISGKYSIKEGTILIANYAFYDCASLTSITIPDTVKYICTSAFYECTALTEINFNATALEDLSYNNYAFHYAGQSGDGIKVNVSSNVTKIPAYLFYPYSSSSYEPKIINVVFEDGSVCESIGEYAFNYCTSLENVTLYSGITSIGEWAFNYCTSLTSITIPDSVTYIGNGAFSNCTALTEINFNATAMDDLSSDNYVFYNAGQSGVGITVNIGAKVTKIPNYLFFPSYNNALNILNVVFVEDSECESIGNYAFYNCTSLTSIIIPDSVKSIGSSAFSGCSSLKNVIIGNGVKTIDNYAFGGCVSLESVTIGKSVETIGYYAFGGSTALNEINFNATTMEDLSSSYNNVFYNAGQNGDGITVNIGANVTKIPAYLFCPYYSSSNNYSPKITCIVFESGSQCSSIGNWAFYGCTTLESVYYNGTASQWASITFNGYIANPLYYAGKLYLNGTLATDITLEDITTISAYAFYGYPLLKSVTIGSSITSIGNYAFYNCTALTLINFNATAMDDLSAGNCSFYCAGLNGDGITVTVGSNVTKIPAYLFCAIYSNSYAPKITSIVFENGSECTSIGNRAFSNCPSIKSITIPDSVTSIGEYTFYECVAQLIWGNNPTITEIGSYAFASYAGTSLTIPNSVTSISARAFHGCVAEIIWSDNSAITEIGDYAFASYAGISFTIPDSVVTVGDCAFNGCVSLISVVIGSSVTNIDDNAFYGCYKLVEVYNLSALDITAGSSGNGDVAYYAKNVYTETNGKSNILYSGEHIFYNDNGSYYLMCYTGTGTDISLPDDIDGYDYSIYQYAFYNCTTLTNIVIPDNVISIGDYSFYGCASLESITIGNGVTSIGIYSFNNCTALTSIIIPDGVTFIGSGAFRYCSSLTNITLPDSITSIGNETFYDTAYYNDENNWENDVLYIGNYLIKANSSISGEYTIKESTTVIADYAFYDCSSLTSITIGTEVTNIGWGAFSSCGSVTEIYFNATDCDDFDSWSYHPFQGCGCDGVGFTLYIGSNVKKIPAYFMAWKQSSSPYEAKIIAIIFEDNSVCESIGEYAFSFCFRLTNITISESVTSIGEGAFNGCYKLVEVYNLSALDITAGSLGNGNVACYAKNVYTATSGESNLIYSGDYIFYNDDGTYYLICYTGTDTDITLPDNINGYSYLVYKYAFYNYYDTVNLYSSQSFIISITISSGVTSIGEYAFYSCTSLTSVTFENTSGWYVTTTEGATSGTLVDVTDTSANATYLKTTYCNYYWYRSENLDSD